MFNKIFGAWLLFLYSKWILSVFLQSRKKLFSGLMTHEYLMGRYYKRVDFFFWDYKRSSRIKLLWMCLISPITSKQYNLKGIWNFRRQRNIFLNDLHRLWSIIIIDMFQTPQTSSFQKSFTMYLNYIIAKTYNIKILKHQLPFS